MRLLPILIVVGAGIGVGSIVWACWRSSTPAPADDSPAGFRWLLRNPDAWQAIDDSFARRASARAAARNWTDEQVAAAVHRFVLVLKHSEDDEDDLARTLARVPERAARCALLLLENPHLADQLRRTARPSHSQDGLLESPAERACSLLSDWATPAAIPSLQELLHDRHDGTRKEAAMALGRTGDPAAIDGLRTALADADEYVRNYAVMGLERAEKAGQLAPTIREQLVEPLLDAAVARLDDDAAKLATSWNAAAALTRFRAAGMLTTGANPRAMRMALDALTEANSLLARQELLQLWQQRPGGDDHFEGTCRGAIVRMLAAHGSRDDDALLRELMLADRHVAKAAARATMQRLGLGDLGQRIDRKRAANRLNRAERCQDAMWGLDAEVRNGGFDQYFFNSAGGDWEAALAGFVAHDPERADILRNAVARFAEPPDPDRKKRQRQLAAASKGDTSSFEALDRRYYALKRPIEVTLTLHASANAAELRD